MTTPHAYVEIAWSEESFRIAETYPHAYRNKLNRSGHCLSAS